MVHDNNILCFLLHIWLYHPHYRFYPIYNVQNTLQYGREKLEICFQFSFCNIKISSPRITNAFRWSILFRKDLMSRLFTMTLFIFSILVFTETKAAFCFKEILVRPKNRFWGNFTAQIFYRLRTDLFNILINISCLVFAPLKHLKQPNLLLRLF